MEWFFQQSIRIYSKKSDHAPLSSYNCVTVYNNIPVNYSCVTIYFYSLDSRRLGAGDSKSDFFFPSFFFFKFLFLLILNQGKYYQQFAVSPSLRRAGKTYYFPAIFETFQLVSVAKNTMLLNSSPLVSRNTVGSRFKPVPVLSCCPQERIWNWYKPWTYRVMR